MDRAALHSQLASVMEVLANAAVAEICKLVDDGYALLRLQVTQAQRENRALKRRIQLLEPGPAREPGSAGSCSGDAAVESREGRPFGRQKRGRGDSEDGGLPPCNMEQSADMEEDAGPESLLIKEERLEEDLERASLHGDLDLRAEKVTVGAAVRNLDPVINTASPKASKGHEEFTEHHGSHRCLSEVSGLETVLKAEPERASGRKVLQHSASEQSTGRLASLYCDYTAYSRRGHLRTFFAHGVDETDADDPSCSYATEMDSEGLSFHSELQHISAAEDAGDSVSVGSADMKPELVMVDSVPEDAEADVCSAWDGDALPAAAVYAARSHDKGEGRGDRKQRESVFDTCPPRVPMTVSESVGESRSDAIDMNGFLPCEASLITPKDIKTQSRMGAREKLFVCTICGKAFNRPKKVEIHLRVHTGEKPFRCTLCGKWFAESGNLKKHQRVHTGEKPFSCAHCGRRFAWIRNLKTHQQRNHM
ncbi:uncharacterized protein [Paramormyrops kingsleyae]|uniref:Ras-responsive element-binding protein 1-like n=1 Tax=Paramormyrops kingsleyae TaxID=1676925 RepID=A0A3B3T1N2_9TELE|nr:ras-responsive element-binding protein 1-like [Paramormyrops kingsleyae]